MELSADQYRYAWVDASGLRLVTAGMRWQAVANHRVVEAPPLRARALETEDGRSLLAVCDRDAIRALPLHARDYCLLGGEVFRPAHCFLHRFAEHRGWSVKTLAEQIRDKTAVFCAYDKIVAASRDSAVEVTPDGAARRVPLPVPEGGCACAWSSRAVVAPGSAGGGVAVYELQSYGPVERVPTRLRAAGGALVSDGRRIYLVRARGLSELLVLLHADVLF